MRSLAANAFTLIIVIGIVVAGVFGYARQQLVGEGPLVEERIFTVPRGATVDRIADILAQEGVITSSPLFRIAARTRDTDRPIRFGEYRIPARASMLDVLDKLRSGQVVQHMVTVPEGLTSWEVVELLRGIDVLTGDVDEYPPEGTLAPDTFSVTRGEARMQLIARMTALQASRLERAWAARSDNIQISTPEEALILASLIERETGVGDERPMVSGVFHNRLRRGMRLQTDPTIIFGITLGRRRFEGPIRRVDIDTPTPWNTYTIDGLPPTPIANPGFASLMAAVQPADTPALFFVADGTGGHAFAVTLEEHNRNVRAWRAIERERGLRQ